QRQEAETHEARGPGEGRLLGGQNYHRGSAMILYLDSSALVKRYLIEARSADVERVIVEADQTGTAMITRAEVSAAIAKAVRMNWVARDEALKSLAAFQSQWA